MGALNSLATVGLDLAAKRQSEKATNDQRGQSRDLKVAGIIADSAEERRQRDGALKRRLAQERARAGASGTGSSGGSIDAVLQGLVAERNAQQSAADRDVARGLDELRDTFASKDRKSLLDFNSRWLDAGSKLISGAGGRRSLLD